MNVRGALRFLKDVEDWLMVGALSYMVCVIFFQVIMRYFFKSPIIWVSEVIESLLLYITFLGSAWLLREEGHVKVDLILNMLRPKTVALFGIVSSIIGIFVSVVLSLYGSRLTWDHFERGIYTPTVMELPIFLILLIIPIGSYMLIIQFVRRAAKFITQFRLEKAK